MKKSIKGIIYLIALFVVVACTGNVTTTPTPTQIPTVTPLPPTTTMSAGFASLLNVVTLLPLPTPVGATALPMTETPQPLATDDPNFIEQEKIKKVIQSYFDIRHRAFSTLKLEGFDDLISKSPEAIAFWESESSKLRVELRNAERNNLRYVAYNYFLYNEKITFDPTNQTAIVSISLSNHVIDEISALITSGEPIISSMSGEDHVIVMQKEDDEWKIVSDIYNDYLWRMLRKSGISIDDFLRLMEAQPTRTPSCFVGVPLSMPFPEQTKTPDIVTSSSPKIKTVYLNGKIYDPEWPYSFPFTNLYFEPERRSILRFVVELDHAFPLTEWANAEWRIVIHPHIEGEKVENEPILVLDNLQTINCDSRIAFLVETTLEEIQKELGDYRVFDYQIVDKNGDIKLEQTFYLNPYGSYLISDTFGDIQNLSSGIIGYPNRIDESKAVFPHTGRAVIVREPRGGFFQLHYLVHVSRLASPSGIWTEETSDGVVVQISSYRDHGLYGADNSYILPDERKIRGKKNFDFAFYFTINELREALGNGNEFYIRFLDREGNMLGQDYFYFLPYSQSTP
jgi:hypothetical protein